MKSIQELEQLNQLVLDKNLSDFGFYFNGTHLTMNGSFDFSYYHDVEVLFEQVSYISIPVYFHWPRFRMADDSECLSISRFIALEKKDKVFCIEAETTSSNGKLPFFLVAQDIKIKIERVEY